jgi:hypothetical protein
MWYSTRMLWEKYKRLGRGEGKVLGHSIEKKKITFLR